MERYPNSKTKKQPIDCDDDNKEVPDEWKHDDYEVAWAALEYERAEWKDFPEKLTLNDDFLRWLCIKDASYFRGMPDHIYDDLEYWRSQETAYSPKLACFLLEAHPVLREDCNFWLKNIEYTRESDVGVTLHEMAAPNIFQHREIMLKMCICHPTPFFTELQSPFLHDEDFIKIVIRDMHSNDLGACSLEALVKFPGTVIPRYARECPSELCRFAELLSADVWEREEYVKEWFTNGGPFAEECFPEEWRSRRDIFLWIAKYCPNEYNECLRSFTCASPHLRTNKSFMMDVIECNPALYQVACSELQQDLNIRILVCSKGNDLIDIRQFGMTAIRAIETLMAAKEKYIADKGFQEYCYCVTQTSPELPVSRMNSDPETSAALSSLVAEYLDVPTGREIQRVRLCTKLLRTIEP